LTSAAAFEAIGARPKVVRAGRLPLSPQGHLATIVRKAVTAGRHDLKPVDSMTIYPFSATGSGGASAARWQPSPSAARP